MTIAIFGAGDFGHALGTVLEQNGHAVRFYDPVKFPDTTPEAALADATATVFCTPSVVAPEVLPLLPADRPLICASKGFLSLAPFEAFPDFALLSGAAFGSDLLERKPTCLTATSPLAAELFQNAWLTIELTSDRLGVMLCGSLKNLYAIGAGYHDLRPGTPAIAEYLEATLAELKDLLAANGCQPATADLSCGAADLRLTCGSTSSRNYQFGVELRTDPTLPARLAAGSATLHQTTEGYTTALALRHSDLLTLPASAAQLRRIITLATGGQDA